MIDTMSATPQSVIAALRETTGTRTQGQVAQLLGVYQSTVSDWLAGQIKMSRPVRMLAHEIMQRHLDGGLNLAAGLSPP